MDVFDFKTIEKLFTITEDDHRHIQTLKEIGDYLTEVASFRYILVDGDIIYDTINGIEFSVYHLPPDKIDDIRGSIFNTPDFEIEEHILNIIHSFLYDQLYSGKCFCKF